MDTEQRIMQILLEHDGGWIDNGTPDVHCRCGRRGRLGELHTRHVAEILMAHLGLT